MIAVRIHNGGKKNPSTAVTIIKIALMTLRPIVKK